MAFDTLQVARIAHVNLEGPRHALAITRHQANFEKLQTSLPCHFVLLEDADCNRVLVNLGTQFGDEKTVSIGDRVNLLNMARMTKLYWSDMPAKNANVVVARRLQVLKS